MSDNSKEQEEIRQEILPTVCKEPGVIRRKILPNVWFVGTLLAGLGGALIAFLWFVTERLSEKGDYIQGFADGTVIVLIITAFVTIVTALAMVIQNLTAPDGPPPSVPLPAFDKAIDTIAGKRES